MRCGLLHDYLARGAVGIADDVHAAVRSGRQSAAQVVIAYGGRCLRRTGVVYAADARGAVLRREGLSSPMNKTDLHEFNRIVVNETDNYEKPH